jgi:hypothetical protein
LRAGVLENWKLTTDYSKNHTPTDWQAAQVSSDKGMGRKLAADSQWLGESSFAGNAILGAAMLADADLFAQSYAEAAAAGIDLQSLHSTNRVALTYSLWINNRMGLPFDLVPGYAQLDVDAGQFDVLKQLYQMQVQQGKCTVAEQTWYKLQGSLYPGRVKLATPPDTCIAKVE